MKTIIALLLVLVTWFFLEEDKHEQVKIKPFCLAEENLNFLFEIRFYLDIDGVFLVLSLYSRAMSASFNVEKKKKKSLQFLVQQGSQKKKVSRFLPSSLPF